jgi:hypothetical protein
LPSVRAKAAIPTFVFDGKAPVQMLPFGSAQLPRSGVRDTNQLVELALFGIPDAAAKKNPVVN